MKKLGLFGQRAKEYYEKNYKSPITYITEGITYQNEGDAIGYLCHTVIIANESGELYIFKKTKTLSRVELIEDTGIYEVTRKIINLRK